MGENPGVEGEGSEQEVGEERHKEGFQRWREK